ncbi:MAG: DNA gyrase subunit A [Dehalococcoidia bacterium]
MNENSKTSIINTQIKTEMEKSYLDYAMSVIVSRALPDLRDGLKPVHRRILYAMQDIGARPNSSYYKSARIVGEVLGKYHPHSDTAVYDSMVRMAQDFSLRAMLIDGQGNYGSIDNDPPAAMRYTEARLSSIAEEMLANLHEETVDFEENFDGSLKEPVVLPTRLPNLLINGGAGIAVGMATNIPTHNPYEICEAVNFLIDNPLSEDAELLKIVKGPDFPTGGLILGREGIQSAYMTGRGSVMMRAVAEIEESKNDRFRIVIKELPYQVNKAGLVEKIADLSRDKKIEGISEIRDESDREGIRVVIELRRATQPMVVLNNLYKLTPMQTSFAVNMVALDKGTPKTLTLKQALQGFIEFREEVVNRRSKFELKNAKNRIHILEGLLLALADIDKVISTIRNSKDSEDATANLISEFKLSNIQAKAILEMQLRRLAALETEKIKNEYKLLEERIKELEIIIDDKARRLAIVKEETIEVSQKFTKKRLTKIIKEEGTFDRAALEPHESVVVTLSSGQYIKRIPTKTYQSQHAAGRGKSAQDLKEDDPMKQLLVVDTHDILLFFTNKGRVFSLNTYELRADVNRSTRGVPILNLIQIDGVNEKITSMISAGNLKDYLDSFLIFATKKGTVKKLSIKHLSNIRKSGLKVINMSEDDELVNVRILEPEEDIMIITSDGLSIRFPNSDLRELGRNAAGVRGIKLKGQDYVVAMDVGLPEDKLFVISREGKGKMTRLNKADGSEPIYRIQKRAGSGVKTFKLKNSDKVSHAEIIPDDTDYIYIISDKGLIMVNPMSEMKETSGRNTGGNKIMNVSSGDSVSCFVCVKSLSEEKKE